MQVVQREKCLDKGIIKPAETKIFWDWFEFFEQVMVYLVLTIMMIYMIFLGLPYVVNLI